MKHLERLEKKLLRYMHRAISEYSMIQKNDRVLVCLSGGKDSFSLLYLLNKLRVRSDYKFSLFALTIDQGIPGWRDEGLRPWLKNSGIDFEILKRNTYSIVKQKIPENKSPCPFCARLRRGIIYSYAKEHGFKKIALGHHRDDLIETFLMAALYSGAIRSMPPKLLTNDKKHIVFRPLCYCQEKDIANYAKAREFPVLDSLQCAAKSNGTRQKVKLLIQKLAQENRKIPSNLLHALRNINVSQLMDKNLWDFEGLDM